MDSGKQKRDREKRMDNQKTQKRKNGLHWRIALAGGLATLVLLLTLWSLLLTNPQSGTQYGPPYTAGHGIFCAVPGSGARSLAEKITFVDKDNAADPQQDGTAEHPFASIQAAVDKAGENAILFVYEADGLIGFRGERHPETAPGAYEEAVQLQPGQTLTSVIDLPDHPAGKYATVHLPLIKPKQTQKMLCNETMTDCPFGVLVMPEQTTLRRMRVVSDQENTAAVWVEPGAVGPDSRVCVLESVLQVTANNSAGVFLWVDEADEATTLGELLVRDCDIEAKEEKSEGLKVWLFNEEASLQGLTVERNRIQGRVAGLGLLFPEPSAAQQGTVVLRGNEIAAVDEQMGLGIFMMLSARMEAVNISDNTVSGKTRGIAGAIGARRGARLCGNRFTVIGEENVAGLVLILREDAAFAEGLVIRDNAVTVQGRDALGIRITENESGTPPLDEARLAAENSIRAEGKCARKVRVKRQERNNRQHEQD